MVRLSKEQGFQPLTGVRVTSTRKVLGIPGKATDNNAFWQTGVTSSVDGYGGISFSDEGVSLDRVTGEATNCCGDYQRADGTPEAPGEMVPVTISSSSKFPFDVQQQTTSGGTVTSSGPCRSTSSAPRTSGSDHLCLRAEARPRVVGHNDGSRRCLRFSDPGERRPRLREHPDPVVEPVTGVIIRAREGSTSASRATGLTSVGATVGRSASTTRRSRRMSTPGAQGRRPEVRQGPLGPVGLVLGLLPHRRRRLGPAVREGRWCRRRLRPSGHGGTGHRLTP